LRLSNEILKKPTAIKALMVLKERGPLTLSSLARELGTNKARLKRYMVMLAEQGLVEVEECCGMRVYKVSEEYRGLW